GPLARPHALEQARPLCRRGGGWRDRCRPHRALNGLVPSGDDRRRSAAAANLSQARNLPMVDVHSGREAVRAYVRDQAGRGLAHVISLIRADRNAMAALTDGLNQAESELRAKEGEFCVLEVLQHLNGSFGRSLDRLATL